MESFAKALFHAVLLILRGNKSMKNFLRCFLTGTCRLILLPVVFVLLLQPSALAQISGVRAGSGPARIRIVLDMDGPAKFKEHSAPDGIVLDIDTAAKNSFQRKLTDDTVTDVVLEKTGKTTARLQVSLKKPAQHKVLVLKNPDRIVVDVYRIQIVKITKDLGSGLSYTYWQDDMSGLPVRIMLSTFEATPGPIIRPWPHIPQATITLPLFSKKGTPSLVMG